MAQKPKITFVVPATLQKELMTRVIKDGYGMRGKSKWVAEAIYSLLAMKGYTELVNYSDEMHGFEKVETIVIDYALQVKLEHAIVETRKLFPMLEGVKSRIARTAIIQRLLRS